MSKRLTSEEIAARMLELRNLRRLHANCQKVKDSLRAELRDVKAKLTAENMALKQQLNKQALQIAELQQMVFGKKRRPPSVQLPPFKAPAKVRPADSYRRTKPLKSSVTETKKLKLPNNCSCGGQL